MMMIIFVYNLEWHVLYQFRYKAKRTKKAGASVPSALVKRNMPKICDIVSLIIGIFKNLDNIKEKDCSISGCSQKRRPSKKTVYKYKLKSASPDVIRLLLLLLFNSKEKTFRFEKFWTMRGAALQIQVLNVVESCSSP